MRQDMWACLKMVLEDPGGMAVRGSSLHQARHSHDKAGHRRAPAAGHVCGSDADGRQLALQRRRGGHKGCGAAPDAHAHPQHGLPQAADLAGECHPAKQEYIVDMSLRVCVQRLLTPSS